MNKALLLGLVALGASACVSQGKYDEAVAQTELTRAELRTKDRELSRKDIELRQANTEADRAQGRVAELRTIAANAAIAERAAAVRAALYREVMHRLQSQIDAGDLKIVVRDGRMVLELSNDVLFDTGRTDIKPAGRRTLAAVAEVLKSLSSRQFQIAGHNDDVPIKTAQFPSNWELSSARAIRVVRFLVDEGVLATQLSAAGYADVDPVESNATAEGRKHNRRMEITLQPSLVDVVRGPQLETPR